MELTLTEQPAHMLGLRLQGMARMRAEALEAFNERNVSHAERHDNSRPTGLPYLTENVLHYEPDQVEYLIGSVRNLIGIEQKKYTQIKTRRPQYESPDGDLDETVTLKAATRQNAICKQHEVVLCALRELLAQLAPGLCQELSPGPLLSPPEREKSC